jgi:hypothetical protein
MAKMSTKARNELPKKSFALPKERAYPLTDRAHAANAKARVAQFGTPAEKAKVAKAVAKKFPDMGAEKPKAKGKKAK